MIWKSIRSFLRFDAQCRIVLAVLPDFNARWEEVFGEEERSLGFDVMRVDGGYSRIGSVRNGLRFIAANFPEDREAKVFIHDGARPFILPATIAEGAEAVARGRGAIPVVPMVDSLRQLTPEGSRSVDRAEYVAVQTPQIFLLDDILKAYEAVKDEAGFTDDASVAENYGLKIVTFKGERENIKITTPLDFILAERIDAWI